MMESRHRSGSEQLSATSNGNDEIMHTSRAYQLEMLQSSLEGNTIVVMDTGSGKTHVAILRIMIQLERDKDSKLVWFLTPTVTLCIQQFRKISQNLPSVSVRLIIGSDNVERWSTPEIWDRVLAGHRIVVSTHAILCDALSHGFMTMSRLGLLVFDEAHHCIGEHPANKIMREYYYPSLRSKGSDAVPHILGLTASPVMRSNANQVSLRLVESNLNALSKSPRIHLAELRRHVHSPELIRIDYDPQTAPKISPSLETSPTSTLGIAYSLTYSMNAELLSPSNTRLQSEAKSFCRKAEHIYSELGPWAAQRYMCLISSRLTDQILRRKKAALGWQEDDQNNLQSIHGHLRESPSIQPQMELNNFKISPKVKKLIEFLVSQHSSRMSGILFVDQRATAAMLQRLLSEHADTKHLSYATFVGTSNPSKFKSSLSEIGDLDDQRDTLEDFRAQKCNMIIATSVLEEGIDISSCNLVICFNNPANLKSFIQRRGRAREHESTFVLMLAREDVLARSKNWNALEASMTKMYQDQRRGLEHALHMEELVEHGHRRFSIESTEALLTLDSAVPHLNHFCAVLPARKFVDYRPLYHFHEESISGLLKAEVILPNCLDPSIRRALGTQYWRSEKQAKKDAAFEAYVALYHAGLVNDHLLPQPRFGHGLDTPQERRLPRLILLANVNPWAHSREIWHNFPNINLYSAAINIERPSQSPLRTVLILPEKLPTISSCKLFRSSTETYAAHFENVFLPGLDVKNNFMSLAREINYTILQSVHSQRMLRDRTDTVTVFVPSLNPAKLAEWKMANVGTESASIARQRLCPPASIVRNPSLWNSPQLFTRWLDGEALEVVSPPRKRNFLELERSSNVQHSELCKKTASAKVRSLPIENTTFDKLSPTNVEFSLLVPSLMRHIEKYSLAGQLATSILSTVKFHDLDVVVEALSAPSACDTGNYQRLEYIGDTVLKFIVVCQLFTIHHNWHEGYLSQAKDRLVANLRLALAAIQNNLDQFIMSTPFTPRKWIPPYVHELPGFESLQKRYLSKKVLADVVEALIGAAYVDGGLQRAAECVHTFLPEVKANAVQEMFQRCNLPEQTDPYQQHNFADLQRLMDIQFRSVSILVEAVTHPSLTCDLSTQSYQRLEFLGDAVIDILIVQRLANHTPPLTHHRMHLIQSALANTNFQAFLCMDFSLEQEIFDVIEDTASATVVTKRICRRVALCEFMRHQSVEITKARHDCTLRYQKMAAQIRDAIEYGKWYPWSMLTRLEAPKYLADIVESIFAAVLVDSEGDLPACEKLAERIGLMTYLSRILRDDIDLRHPKTMLSELAVGRGKVRYRIRKVETPCEEFRCTVTVGSRKFEEIVGGTSREEVTVRAAQAAVIALGQFNEGET